MSWIVVTKSPHIKGVVRNEAKWFPKTYYSVWAVRYCSAAQLLQKRTMDKNGSVSMGDLKQTLCIQSHTTHFNCFSPPYYFNTYQPSIFHE